MSGFFYFLFSVVVLILVWKAGLFNYFGDTAHLFAEFLNIIFKTLIGVVNGTYNPASDINSNVYMNY